MIKCEKKKRIHTDYLQLLPRTKLRRNCRPGVYDLTFIRNDRLDDEAYLYVSWFNYSVTPCTRRIKRPALLIIVLIPISYTTHRVKSANIKGIRKRFPIPFLRSQSEKGQHQNPFIDLVRNQ